MYKAFSILRADRAARQRPRGFTLVEAMLVLTIAGILVSLATPNMSYLVRAYTSQEDARQLHVALLRARGLSYQRNEPIIVEIKNTKVVLRVGDYGAPPHGFLLYADNFIQEIESIPLADSVTIDSTGDLTVGSVFAFCPTGEFRFVDLAGEISPDGAGGSVCGLAQHASHDGELRFYSRGQAYTISLNALLGTSRLIYRAEDSHTNG